MNLQQAIDTINSLGGKASGHLIRWQDWNNLMSALGQFGVQLQGHDTQFATVDAKVSDLTDRLTALEALLGSLGNRIDDIETQIGPLLGNYLVSMSATKANYAMGEICEITAKVTNLHGQALSAPYPWVDFVAAWGKLRAKAGFITREGAGDNSLSVQVNAQGIAKVLLRANNTEGLQESEENQVGFVLAMQVANIGMTVSQAFMQSSAPTDHNAIQAYKVVNTQYDRKDNTALRNYADAYHVGNTGAQFILPGFNYGSQWHDYRATVMAFAKPDADPVTPDGARGSATIQITFRDWLWSWSQDYLGDRLQLQDSIFGQIGPIFQDPDPLHRFDHFVNANYIERGIIGRNKFLQASVDVLDRVNPGGDPFKQAAKDDMLFAVGAQQMTEFHGAGVVGNPRILQAQLRQSKQTSGVKKDIGQVSQQVEENQGIFAAVNVLEGRMQAAETVGHTLSTSLTLINDNVRAINPLDENSIKSNVLKISSEIASINSIIKKTTR